MAADKAIMIKKLQDSDMIYAAYSQATRMPFATCDENTYNDQAWLFTDESDIQKFAKEYTEKHIPLMGVKVEKKQAPTFYMNLYAMGINELVFCTEGEKYFFGFTDVIKVPDFEKQEERQRPLLNPALQLSVVYFLQELRRPGAERNQEVLKELEEEVSANLIKSEFIMPVDIDQKKEEKDPTRYLLPYIKNKEGKCYQPLFSDTGEVIKHGKQLKNDGKKHEFIKVPFEKLDTYMATNCDGYVLNPEGYALTLHKEQIEIIKKYFGNHNSKENIEE